MSLFTRLEKRAGEMSILEFLVHTPVTPQHPVGLLPLEFTDCLQDSPYFRENLQIHEKELKRTNQQIKELTGEVKKLLAAAKTLSHAQRNFSEKLIDFKFDCIGSKLTDDEEVIAGSLKEFGHLIVAIEDERDKMLAKAYDCFVGPLEKFRKDYIETVMEEKKKFEKKTSNFCRSQEHHLARKKTDSDMQDADAKLEEEHLHFVQAGLDYVYLIQEVQERKKFEFVETIQAFMNSWFAFYHHGHDVAENIRPFSKDLQMRVQNTRENFYSSANTMRALKRQTSDSYEANLRKARSARPQYNEMYSPSPTGGNMYSPSPTGGNPTAVTLTGYNPIAANPAGGSPVCGSPTVGSPNQRKYKIPEFARQTSGGTLPSFRVPTPLDPGALDKNYTRSGYLFLMEKRTVGIGWSRCYCHYIKENKLFIMIPYSQISGKGQMMNKFTLKSCVKRTDEEIDRRFCFDLASDDRGGLLYTLQAQSEDDWLRWIEAMDGTDPMYSRPGKGKKQSSADQSFLDEVGFKFVLKCIKVLEDRGLEEKGLYRVNGVSSKIAALLNIGLSKDEVSEEMIAEWGSSTITSAIKRFYHNMPEPIMTFSLHHAFIAAAKLKRSQQRIEEIQRLMQQLPSPNIRMLQVLLQHLSKVAAKKEVNQMPECNLALCFGPTLLRPEEETVAAIMDIKFGNVVIEILIQNWQTILRTDKRALSLS